MSDEKQLPLSSSPSTMSTNYLQASTGLDHRNISSPSSAFDGAGYPFSELGIGSHGSPKSSHGDHDSKDDSRLDLYNDVKGLAITLPFQDTDPSVTSTPSTFSHLSYKPPGSGDAMLSAINYNENDILPEALDVNLAGPLPNLNDDILSNMGAPGDLFDGEGNVSDPYMDDYSPQASNDFGGFGSDNYNIDSDHGMQPTDPNKALEGMKLQKKPKPQKSPKGGQLSPARLAISSLQCPTCNKSFTNSSALAKHKLTHSDERKYVCNICQKAFKRQDHLNGHLMTHREKKPYECSVDNCTKSYCDARSLRRHLENHHNQTPEQIHSAIALVASNAAAVIAAAAATNSAQNKANQTTHTVVSVPILPSTAASSENSQGSDIKPLSFSSDSTPATSPVFNDPNQMYQVEHSQPGSVQTTTPQPSPAVKQTSEDDSVGQRVQMLLDQASAAQIGTDDTITLHGAQGQQTVKISADNLPQAFTIQPCNALLKQMQPQKQWPEQCSKANSTQSSIHSSSPRSGEPSPSYLQQVSPISPVPNAQVTTPSPVQVPTPQRNWTDTVSPVNLDKNGDEVNKQTECSICKRVFKNVQALNGHMRCHGGYFKRDTKEEKKNKKKDMAPPKSTPKGNKLIASMPHPSPLDQVGSPPSGSGSVYGSQLQSPVSVESGSEAPSAIVVQPIGFDQLQQIQIQQQQGELQQQLQQQLQILQMEQSNVEFKINQLKEQIQQQNQQLTQKQVAEQSMQQELQLQSALQQQIVQLQQLQVDSAQNQQRQNILQNINTDITLKPLDQKLKKLTDGDISIMHNLHNPTGTQFLQSLQQNLAAKEEAERQIQHNLAAKQEADRQIQQNLAKHEADRQLQQNIAAKQEADRQLQQNIAAKQEAERQLQLKQEADRQMQLKQEADRQLHDIQAILKLEAENETNSQTQRKQPISKEEMEKHLMQRLLLQTTVGGTIDPSVTFQHGVQAKASNLSPIQHIGQPKASIQSTSFSHNMGQSMPNNQGHVNSVLLEKMKQQVFSTIPYSSGQSPALIHHLPQAKEESTPDPASVPTTQVPARPTIVQRQVSFEETQHQTQFPMETPSPQQITNHQLQQLLQQRNDTLNSQQSASGFSEPMRHIDLSPPPMTLNPNSIQSNLQTAIAQIPQFDLKTPTEPSNVGQSFVPGQSQHFKGDVTSTDQDLSLILETIGNPYQKSSLSSAKTILPSQQSGQEKSMIAPSSHGQLQDNRRSTIVYSHFFSDQGNGIENLLRNKDVPLIDPPGQKAKSDHPLYKPEARKPEPKAAEQNPFLFPGVDGNHNDFARPENIKNTKHHRHKTNPGEHTELKRRLSVGNEHDLDSTSSILQGMGSNNKGHTSSAKFNNSISAVTFNKTNMKPRMRSKSGDDYKYYRSNSEDHTFMRPRSQTEECLWKYKQKSVDSFDQPLSKSDGAGLFRNPNCLTNFHLRIKRKHRPAPLFIPGNGGSGGFQSRLRSPRVLTGEHKGNTPPPYTPPPMLSPIRSGSGLFWNIQRPPMTPMTAPVTPRTSLLAMSRSTSISSATADIKVEETDTEAPPETDILPHVNIGSQYQAEIPPFNSNKKDALKTLSKEDLVFCPEKIKECLDEEVQYFQDFANSAAVQGNGCNTEYALHVLHMCAGNLQKAMLMLMESSRELPASHTLLSYTYQENDVWTTEESEKYMNALLKCDKDFYSISKEIGTKSVKECIQYYYLWKKVCPDEHKRLRVIRNKRERERLYNLRSQQQQQQQQPQEQQGIIGETSGKVEMDFDNDSGSSTDMEDAGNDLLHDKEDDSSSVNTSAPPSVTSSPAPVFTCDYPDCYASFNSKQALNGHIRVHGGGSKSNSPAREYKASRSKPQGSPASMDDINGEGFPCKLCGRVFPKIRSRSAHMKSHRMNEADKKAGPKKPVPVPVEDNMIPKMSPNGNKKIRIDFSPTSNHDIPRHFDHAVSIPNIS